ncbi:MAG: multifunctional oxoglutarate decarboxylase/oxoglutarate dehydrogenase thiamine pyrophosphate-binding subunit/dihydrolipoyllysine-residue succinyltransferase subunit [Ignavibacteriae bacterium]|nr:multifunctional oxoglutarate decarboxylase/oxoglutarate dehydrogenase thiamine pyrophosphate-binding subunit/dihydrolipoyllysine-residue succinyltransferase subunit [Ignavibacteriota bacterium]
MRLEDLTEEQREKISEFGVNTWFVLDLFSDYKKDPSSVSDDWKDFFKDFDSGELGFHTNGGNGKQLTLTPSPKPAHREESKVVMPKPGEGEEPVLIKGAGARIIDNMTDSLSIPTATTFRELPVKLLEENRIVINNFLKQTGGGKISYTHIIGWAIVKAIETVPNMNNSFTVMEGQPYLVKKHDVNLGLAVDIQKKDGSRSLIVPNIKKANGMNFKEYFDAYNDIIDRSRTGKIEVADFQGTSISLTNPGTIGTSASHPRLMMGQGAIIATGSIDYPPEFRAATKDVLVTLGVSKVMNMTSTYDHRIIQGAESGIFLKRINDLLMGQDDFYDEIFRDLKVNVLPVYWTEDDNAEDFVGINNIKEIEKQAKVIQLINMFRVRGHLQAHLDPLSDEPKYHKELDSSYYGLTIWDFDREFITDGLAGLRTASLRDILDILLETYCGNIGVEFKHIQDPEEKEWLQSKMEPVRNKPILDNRDKKNILYKLMQAENFEKFIDRKYLGHKRFSLEGSETIIAVLDHLLNIGAEAGVEEMVLGMAHRGRLNVLANIIGKSMHAIFSEFEDNVEQSAQGSGDVKYHLGATGTYETIHDKKINVAVASNPSHLEFVNPVVEGIVRAKQTRQDDVQQDKFVPVLLHGDAAFAGEGIVAETLNLSQLQGYSTGGTVHIVINNQIGFTTAPVDARSTVYATDVAKMVQAPIFHVNGDDPEATMWVTQLAFEFRQKFNKDVVIDVFGYRRLGHNETDEPAYTQPLMYKKIRSMPSVVEKYKAKLLKEQAVTDDEVKAMEHDIDEKMDKDYNLVKNKDAGTFEADAPLAVTQEEIKEKMTAEPTKVSAEELDKVVNALTTVPEGFTIHPKLKKFVESRGSFPQDADFKVDWAFAESLAFGTLMLEGTPIRLSGQDSARGTFSQRHVVLTDANTGAEIIPLNQLDTPAKIEPLDSLLSEAAVLGFEYGYSTADPITLVMWEAQFGDFANAAQVIIDNFISCSYTKWDLPNNVVMLLPHAQEGQGPEHSSARLERYLALCAEDNMFVTNPTTPAQYFHLLRRRAKAKFPKPLIIMTPKSLLRDKMAVSVAKDFTDGHFHEVLNDERYWADGSEKGRENVTRVVLTSGKVYYDLVKYMEKEKIEGVAVLRTEQYYPFPEETLKEMLAGYKNAKDVVWVQEEPENMGAWLFMSHRLPHVLAKGQKLDYVGRKASASPAPGSKRKFDSSQELLMKRAFGVE